MIKRWLAITRSYGVPVAVPAWAVAAGVVAFTAMLYVLAACLPPDSLQ
ncbi:hypothetical protein [Nonomuraea rhodomycinica]|uniref:Uncharacterized protein n=1 Tax=Nonomuraea rhodomycinica TaxID=1712872 RepID=A0A7Y6IRB6_9ACTN|nr:hypothetical protein [Nonomuraea rhodomycinica]NUW42810.1 hypothetical protein [Nonomuraea rhodomycinica]